MSNLSAWNYAGVQQAGREQRSAWSTADEIKFLKSLGQYGSSAKLAGRRALLRGYVEALDKRRQWGDLSPATVRAYAEAELAQA
jgi:hypothetical protein